MFDDAACTTQSSDQAWGTTLAGYLSDDTYAVAYSCHKDGVLTSMKADSEYKPGEQIAITLWDTCSSADVYNYKISTTATYGGDDKVGGNARLFFTSLQWTKGLLLTRTP